MSCARGGRGIASSRFPSSRVAFHPRSPDSLFEPTYFGIGLTMSAHFARLARPISRQPRVGRAAEHQPAGSRLTLERVLAVVCVRLHPLADRVNDAVDGGLRRRDQLSHLEPPSVTGAPSAPS